MSESKDLVDLCVFLSLCRLKDMECLRKTHEEATHWIPLSVMGLVQHVATLYSSIFGRGVFHCFPDSLRRWLKKAKNRTRRCCDAWHWNFLMSDWVLGIDFRQWNLWKQRNRLPWQSLRSGGVASLVCDWWKAVCWYKNVGWLRARLV